MDTDVELTVEPAAGGRRRWRPDRRVWSLGAALLSIGATGALLLVPDDDPDADTVAVVAPADDPTTTETTAPATAATSTTAVETMTTDTTATAAAAVVPTTITPRRSTTTTTGPTTTATTIPAWCRNSTDPACGPFYWDPAPGPNQPLTISFVKLPTRWNRYDGGLQVTFQWSDPDGWVMYYNATIDGTDPGRRGACPENTGYGPWTPNEAQPTPHSGTASPNPVYFPAPGVYTLSLGVGTLGCGWAGRSDAMISATIEVYEPAPEDPPPAEG